MRKLSGSQEMEHIVSSMLCALRRRRRKWITIAATLTAAATALAACGSATTATASSSRPKNAKYTIGLSVPDTTDSYFIAIYKGFEAEAKKLGMTTNVVDASGSVTRQIQQVETLGASHDSAVVVDTINTTSIVPAIKELNNDHVPVFTVDNAPAIGPMKRFHASVVSTIQSNNFECGLNDGKELIKYLGGKSANVGQMYLEPIPEDTNLRHEGFHAAIAKDPKIKIVRTVGGPISFSGAVKTVSALLEGDHSINVVYAGVGPNAQGAAEAVSALHLIGKVVVVGNTSETGPINWIENGVIVGGATQSPYKEGYMMASRVYDYLTGKNKKPPHLTMLPCTGITKANAAKAYAYAKSVGLTG